MIFKCYSSKNLIALNTLTRLSPPGTHFTAELTEAMQIKSLAQRHNILMPGFKLSASVSRKQHSSHMTNMLHTIRLENTTMKEVIVIININNINTIKNKEVHRLITEFDKIMTRVNFLFFNRKLLFRPSHFNPCLTRPKSISPQKSQKCGDLYE